MTKLSIVVPVLNEGRNIVKLVEEIKKEKKKVKFKKF